MDRDVSGNGAEAETPARVSKAGEELDRSIDDSLDSWIFIEPFDAVERLHSEAAKKGLSRSRLAGLSFGYAQLGHLSGHLWTSIHETFSARGLIYAQRLVNLDAALAGGALVSGLRAGVWRGGIRMLSTTWKRRRS